MAMTFIVTIASKNQMRRNETLKISLTSNTVQIPIPAARKKCNLARFQAFSTQHIVFLITSGLKCNHFKVCCSLCPHTHAFLLKEPSGPSGIKLVGIWPVVALLMRYLLQMLLFVSLPISVCA